MSSLCFDKVANQQPARKLFYMLLLAPCFGSIYQVIVPLYKQLSCYSSYSFCCLSESTGLRAIKSFSRLNSPTSAWAPMLYLPSSSDVLGTKSATLQLLFDIWRQQGIRLLSWNGHTNRRTHSGYTTPWSRMVRSRWWQTGDWSCPCCTRLSW